MIELATGTVLASAAGLNAYIPLLGLGILSRFTQIVELPSGWAWLEHWWALGVIGVLLIVELLVDKLPALDTANDVLQSVVRPASGGLVLTAGSSSTSIAVEDPADVFDSGQVWLFVVGAVVALIPHVVKLVSRLILNALTAGAAAPAVSVAEDITAVTLTVLAFIVPLLALALAVLAGVFMVRRLRALSRRRRERQTRPNTATL